jgi:hypothetical protein
MRIKLKDILPLSQREELIVESLQTLQEITLDIKNAAPIKGGLKKGSFEVGGIQYTYSINDFDIPIILPGDKDKIQLEPLTIDIGFSVEGDAKDLTSNLPKGGKENLIKIYSTIFKIITTVAKSLSPNNIMISSYDVSGYFPIYNNLTKTNSLPGYSRKTIIKWENEGAAATSIVLKKNN